MSSYRFDSVARSERYFTATLLSHLLLAQNFLGLQAVFQALSIVPSNEYGRDEFEIVTELAALRDLRYRNARIDDQYREYGRGVVPDIFLRWCDQILIVEAKFFSPFTEDELLEQVGDQKQVIELVLAETAYTQCNITYAVLAVQDGPVATNWPKDIQFITWSDLIEALRQAFSGYETPDISYCFDILCHAEERRRKELAKSEQSWKRVPSLHALLAILPELMEEHSIFVGFTGGKESFMQASLKELEQRSHYKWSYEWQGKNWLTAELLMSRYQELKTLNEDAEERSPQENQKKKTKYERTWEVEVTGIGALFAKLPELRKGGSVYVGFTGGEKRLMQTSLEKLEKRRYKLSYKKPNNDWLPVELLISRYQDLKNLKEDVED